MQASEPNIASKLDVSARWPCVAFLVSGIFWLLIGSAFAFISSYKLHSPEFLGSIPWLTFGRVRTAHLNSVIYGFSSMAGIGTLLWLVTRLSRAPLQGVGGLLISAILWNLGVTVGIYLILTGRMQGLEWLEFPPPIWIIFGIAFLFVVWSSLRTFRLRASQYTYVSQWYLFGATLWFPPLYMIANLPIYSGVPQAAMNWWYAHNVLGIWFTPIGLAAAYYFIPKIIGRPIYSYYLSLLGFWSLALFYNWNGSHHLVGGPIPAWLMTASITASVMMAIPVTTVAINHHMTTKGHFHMLRVSPTLRFVVFGAMSYTAVSLQGSTQALRSVARITHFTQHTIAHSHMGMYAFFAMTLFGTIYYILPRVTMVPWPSARAIRWHFWLTGIGIAIYVISLTTGGFIQGFALDNPKKPFIESVTALIPYFWMRTVAAVLMTLGHIIFAVSIYRVLRHFVTTYPSIKGKSA
ncbi:MAG: hypothetical protein A2428_05470 [Bdellovibrionales bacterium RIFOXYC1_FULL_54_43]|nr:MAG: hypothetical protein A2428_05470 [Bdellovibrionales bacterium RIFOXYC1_FULL_54_43]OFZ80976.1 MAG: hypothetical protein A2603_16395 [Bdellovibrionales bacterium RIFOXYD1_FULL_55_31]